MTRRRVVELLSQPERQREYRPELRYIEVVGKGPHGHAHELGEDRTLARCVARPEQGRRPNRWPPLSPG